MTGTSQDAGAATASAAGPGCGSPGASPVSPAPSNAADNTPQDPHRRRGPGGLGLRLALMMLLALLPLGLLSLGQTRDVLEQADESLILAAMGESIQAAEPEILLLRSAQIQAGTMALALGGRDTVDDAACMALAQGIADTSQNFSLVAYTPPSGVMTCATRGAGTDLSENAGFRDLIGRDEPQLRNSPMGSISSTSVIVVTHPVRNGRGERNGFISISVAQDVLTLARSTATPVSAATDATQALVALSTFDSNGVLLTSSVGVDAAALAMPRERKASDLTGGGRQAFFGTDASGTRRLFTVVPITGGLYLLGVWQTGTQGIGGGLGLHPFAFPLLMWIAGLAVAILGAERLVTRHLRRMSRAMRNFTRGDRKLSALTLDDPPREIADLADEYETLTATILRDEADLENLVRQKANLLREVHHRTGNSLQLIASILRMQRRETEAPEMLDLIDTLHDRVMSLSTVHLGLYRFAGRGDVEMDVLLSEVIGKVDAIHWRAGRRDAIVPDLSPLVLTSQQAVPMALLVAEVLSSFPAAEIQSAHDPVHIVLRTLEGRIAELSISGPRSAHSTLRGDGRGAPDIIAARLIRSFVQQLDGEFRVQEGESQLTATLTFPIRRSDGGPEGV